MFGTVLSIVTTGILWTSVLPICTNCISKFKDSPPPTPLTHSNVCYVDQQVKWQVSKVYKYKEGAWISAGMFPSCPVTNGSVNVKISAQSEPEDVFLTNYRRTGVPLALNPNLLLDVVYYSPDRCCSSPAEAPPRIAKMTIEFIWEANMQVFMAAYDKNILKLWCSDQDIVLRSISEDGSRVEDIWGRLVLD